MFGKKYLAAAAAVSVMAGSAVAMAHDRSGDDGEKVERDANGCRVVHGEDGFAGAAATSSNDGSVSVGSGASSGSGVTVRAGGGSVSSSVGVSSSSGGVSVSAGGGSVAAGENSAAVASADGDCVVVVPRKNKE